MTTDEQPKGITETEWVDWLESHVDEEAADILRQALHDRDRFQRERDYWREECIKLTGEALA